MLESLGQLALFTAKALIIVLIALFFLVMVLMVMSKAKAKFKGRLTIRNINKKLDETKEELLAETLTKNQFKKYLKEQKLRLKKEKKNPSKKSNVYVLQFHGDIQASAVASLREEITALLMIATPQDEVVIKLESGGGMVHTYGLAAAQLKRLRDKGIPLTVIVDKIAASGGYLMACIANHLLTAPFAIIGSIGVVFQIPNFHRLLQDKNIDFELITAGNYKRTVTMFGENTPDSRKKLQQELEAIHQQFKNVIGKYRPNVDIEQVSTGEHWLGQHALQLQLVDGLMTSDDYLLQKSEIAQVYEVACEIKKTLSSRFKMALQYLKAKEPTLPMSIG